MPSGSDHRPARGHRRRALAALVLAVSLAVVGTPAGQAQDADGEAFCGLLTPAEIKTAFGTQVEAAPGYGSCDWYSMDGAGDLQSLSAYWSDQSLADTESIFGEMEALTVAGRSARYAQTEYEAILFLDADPGILVLDAGVVPGPGTRAGLVRLGELALDRVSALPEPPALVEAEPEPLPDPVVTALCAALSAAEVAAALGAGVQDGAPSVGSTGSCEWAPSAPTGGFVYFSVGWTDQTLEEVQTIGDGTSLEIGGHPAWATSAAGPELLFVDLDQGLLMLTAVVADGIDAPAALRTLGAAIVARSASLPGPTPLPTPPPSATDDVLKGRFPTTIGGQPVEVQMASGELALSNFGALGEAIKAGITDQGIDVAGVSTGIGVSADYKSYILGIRADGLDAQAAGGIALDTLGSSQEAQQVAGKAVTRVTSESGQTVWFHAAGDTIWIVQAEEPALSEIVAALP